MKISNFTNEYLTTRLAKILQEKKTCLLMGNFNINPLKKDRLEHLRLLQYFAFEFFCSLYFTINKVGKNSKNLSNTTTSY